MGASDHAIRQAVLAAARRRGWEPRLRAAQRRFASTETRRNLLDDHNLRLLMALWLPEDACCVDVGANVGDILAGMVAAAPRGRHIAFEPLPEFAAALRERFPEVEVHACAVADTPGTRTFRHVVGTPALSGFHEHELPEGVVEELTVEVRTLDEVLAPGPPPALVKIDVERAELDVLRGAMSTIADHRPVVAIEHGGPSQGSGELHDLLWKGAGLRAFDLDGRGPLDRAAFIETVAAKRHWNFVFHR